MSATKPIRTASGRRYDIPPSDLWAFVVVVEEESFSIAAQRTGMSQPGISLRVQKLEERLGLRLLNRKKTLSLTDAGKLIYTQARQVLRQMDLLEDQVGEIHELARGHLRIGLSSPGIAIELVAAFEQAHPEITMTLNQRNSWTLVDALRNCELDVCVMTLDTDSADGLTLVELFPQRLAAAVSKDHPAAKRGKLSWTDLHDYRVVLQRMPSMTRTIIDRECDARSIKLTNFLEVPRREMVHEAAAAGLGVGLLFASEVAPDPRLVQVPLEDMVAHAGLYVAATNDTKSLPAIARFLEIAGQYDAKAASR